MQATRRLLSQRQPMIKFLGKRSVPATIDHTPKQHPASATALPPSFTKKNSFAAYRQTAQQHGPLNTSSIGSRPGHSLGPIEPEPGVFFDRNQLGAKYQKLPWSAAEMEAIESGGASMWA
ncbi:uncharacterized protein PV09_03846 [Verruconis gallopava]|uniref:Ribosomal protein S36, mitochondrial n=1 Tax=Verruconis gallopava TaxID=253628 RepID=A0A0D2AFQ5_9PEZI|nr:uncharacterized protein PV09_03846 [Verruconis gallopava]KIW05325.1 hypothetical protein PV09_03846 [Verruconis gallopava]